MNLPNRLTLARVAAVPVMIVLMVIGGKAAGLSAVAIFILASVTDLLDGRIARARGLVTDFGKLMDPMADKLLVTGAMVMMTEAGLLPGWMLVLFTGREFAVSGLRLIAAEKGRVLAAGKLGKLKTVSQMLYVICTLTVYYLTGGLSGAASVLTGILLAVSLTLSTVSGAQYLILNRDLFRDR